MRRIHGIIDLICDTVEQTTNLVERTHDAVVERSVRRFAPFDPLTTTAGGVARIQKTVSAGVFESCRMINRTARVAACTVADVAIPVSSTTAGRPTPYLDAFQSVVNGFWGDSLSRRGNGLDLGMTLRHDGRQLPRTPPALAAAFPSPTTKLCVFVHGLAANELMWSCSAEAHYGAGDVNFGTRLRDDLGFTPIFLRYNTGRHISENGRALASLLAEVLDAYPAPVDEIALVGHSMGGLVARSAAHYAHERDEPWAALLRHVACIGSPHLGAPLEKSVNLMTALLRQVNSAGAQVPAELLEGRSAGVKDLRHGYTVDEEWLGRDPDEVFADARRDVPLVDGVGYYFLATTISRDPDHPLGRLLGDLLVRVPSASGESPEHARRIRFSGGGVIPGVGHTSAANHPDVYEVLRELMAADDPMVQFGPFDEISFPGRQEHE